MSGPQNLAVLLIGFGGPTTMAEVRPFLASVLEGVSVPEERIKEVFRRYEALDGHSPYNESTFRQAKALEEELALRGARLPVLVGFRHVAPSFNDAFLELKKRHAQKAIVFVLSPFRTYASFEKYGDRLLEARRESRAADLELAYTGPFHLNPSFIAAQCDLVERIGDEIPPSERDRSHLVFVAHSVPTAMSDKSGYAGQFVESASRVARESGFLHWTAAYQSRSGRPEDRWLAPDVKDAIRAVDKHRFKNVVLVPIGFLCDNVEIIYDLDEEARREAERNGLRYLRVSTVTDEPVFIQMMADQVLEIAG